MSSLLTLSSRNVLGVLHNYLGRKWSIGCRLDVSGGLARAPNKCEPLFSSRSVTFTLSLKTESAPPLYLLSK